MKLQHKFVSILIPSILGPLLLVAVFVHHQFDDYLQANLTQQLRLLSEPARQTIAQAQQQAEQMLTAMTVNPWDEQTLSIAEQLQNLLESNPELLQLEVLDGNGTQVTRASRLSEPFSSAPILTVESSDIHHLAEVSAPVLTLHGPLQWLDHSGKTTHGSMVMSLPLTALQAFFDNIRRDHHLLLQLTNSKNQWLSEPPKGSPDIRPQDIAENQITIHGNHFLMLNIPLENNINLVGLIPDSSKQRYLEKQDMVISYVAIMSVLLLGFSLQRFLTNWIRKPLRRIQGMMDTIARGEPVQPLELKADDEFNQLASSFNAMRDHLLQSSRQIEELAYFDTLTGLPNKVTSIDTMQHMIEQSKNAETQLAILLLDLDNFKNINDALGHQLGDSLLMQVGSRLKECIRSNDLMKHHSLQNPQQETQLLARFGGDEFTLVLSKLASPDQAAKVAGRILSKLALPFHLQDHEICIGASIGIALYPKDGRTPEKLLKNADMAMYAAKAKGKNNFQFYEAVMEKPMTERLALESSMRSGLDNGEFMLFYQPKVPVQGQYRVEFEALMRWKHPEKGMISPALFIPLAEDTGYIKQLGDWAIESACQQIEHWNKAGVRNLSVSVNLSPVQLNYGNPLQTIERCLQNMDIDPSQLEVEITESGLMRNENHAIEILCQLKECGIRIALDDFGTGYSSLAYLRRFPIDTLKIDRAFIRDLENDPESILMLQSIIDLAHNLKLDIVAEGVETEHQLKILQDRGCQLVQGFYFAKPTEPEQAMSFFQEFHTVPRASMM